jgi:aspartyl-tRNA(Asn)/glutamyl-tRNA(Gln) amidotransferase subunit A
MLQATAGHDPRDENSSKEVPPNFSDKIGQDIKGMRIGLAKGFTYENVDPDVMSVIQAATNVFRNLGAEVEELELPYVQHCLNTYAATMNPEAATIHYHNLRDHPEKLGQGARVRLDLGNMIPATAYVHAQRVRKLMRDGYKEIFKSFDAIISPGSPTRTGKVSADSTVVDGMEVNNRELQDGYTNTYSLTGLPAMVLPGGFSSEGTPIGLQVAGKWFDEATMLKVAHAYEKATGWHLRRPPNPGE